LREWGGFMNMLIIGNGFDLAHKRPTTYADFLMFLDYILLARDFPDDRAQLATNLGENIECCTVKEYILSSFDTRKNPRSESVGNTNTAIQELYNCLDKNVWYEYFRKIWQEDLINGKNWINFEQEILDVINFFDHKITNKYEAISKLQGDSVNEKIKHFWSLFYVKIQQENVQRCIWSDFIDKTYQDLQDLVRCLEIYLDDCVGKMPIQYFSPDIQELKIDSVLSFNYTVIPTDVYPSLANKHPHYIHGYAKTDRPATDNNMVLGVNEYWEGPDKNTHTNFNLYKKFVQRIIKEAGIDYKKVLEYMRSEDNKRRTILENRTSESPYINHIYIFGHSLDITDGDILREVMGADDADTTIFYKDKQQQANQIANLSKVLGQEELLKHTFSISPTVIFKQQSEMVQAPPRNILLS